MNKAQLTSAVAQRAEVDRKTVAAVLDALTATVVETVASGDGVEIKGFGRFEQVHKPARTGRNPQTGDSLVIPAKDVPAFKPFTDFKDAVAGVAKETVAA